jgi:hypothetical protein
MKKYSWFAILPIIFLTLTAEECKENSNDVQRRQQETILAEGTKQVGMPAIKNFRERKILKDILELRDQDGIVTYTYLVAEQTGKLVYLGQTIGYGIPYATQYTSPMYREYGPVALPQADPNGLFSPASAEGTWVLMKDPNGDKTLPVYIEPKIIVSPFKLNI